MLAMTSPGPSMKDLYHRLTREWGSKNRKAESRAHKAKLKHLSREEQDLSDIQNGEHRFRFPPQGGSLCRCQGPCRMIVTRNEALHRQFGPCGAGNLGSMGQQSLARTVGTYRVEHWHEGQLIWSETVPNRLYNQGQFAILDIALRNGTAPASWYIGLMSNSLQVPPVVSSTLLSLNVAGPYELTNGADPGYSARQPINRDATAAGWPTLAIPGGGTNEQATAVTVTFTNTGGSPWADSVRWMFLTTVGTAGDTTGKLISLAQLSVDRLLQPGDRLSITYSLMLI